MTAPSKACGLWGRSRMSAVVAPPASPTGPRSWAMAWWRRPRARFAADRPAARADRTSHRPGHRGMRA